jgi:hypothetical protein
MQPKALTAESLGRYFEESEASISSSNYLGMCEMAVKVSHASVPCRLCEGMGFKAIDPKEMADRYKRIARESDPNKLQELRDSLSLETTCVVCHGSGATTQRRADMATAMHPMFTTVRCGKCKGCGETFPPNDVTAERQDVCLACSGVTYIIPVTVKEKGSSKHGKPPKREPSSADDSDEGSAALSNWVDEDALVERGRVSRELEAIRRADPLIGRAIASYFGPEGDKWGDHKWGRAFALWQHTDAGTKLAGESAERSKGGHGHLMQATDLIATERDAEARAGALAGRDAWRDRRRALIAMADNQARELHTRMQRTIRQTEAA